MEQQTRQQAHGAASRATRIASCAAVAALALGLAACGSSSKSAAKTPKGAPSSNTHAAASAPAKAATKAPAGPKVTHVLVTDTDTKMTLSVAHYAPGNYNFSLKNAGHAKHALTINGPGLKAQTGATVAAGQSTDLIVPLVKGTYQVYSPVGGDRAGGMRTSITVS
jgi:uncharacterized cupredoxin-like copper-binding protein